jgi:hypothetical protein
MRRILLPPDLKHSPFGAFPSVGLDRHAGVEPAFLPIQPALRLLLAYTARIDGSSVMQGVAMPAAPSRFPPISRK